MLQLGYINRTELRYAIDRAKRSRSIPGTARCFFSPPNNPSTPSVATAFTPHALSFAQATASSETIDFARFVDPTPLTVHPRLPLETVMEIFKKVGPRVVLVEHKGKLCGVVTRKDVLKFQFRMENEVNPRDEDDGEREREERLWTLIQRVSEWLKSKVYKRGSIALTSPVRMRHAVNDGVEEEAPIELELDDRQR